MVLDGKSSQEYPVNADFLKTPFLVLHFSCYTLMAFLMMLSVILLSMLMILLSILGVIKQLAFELKSDLRDNVDWGTKWLVDFNAGNWSNNTNGSVLERKQIGALTLALLLKLLPRKLEP